MKPIFDMRKLLVVVLFFYGVVIADGQNFTVEGISPDLYITHTVAPKENFYSVGRLYNQAPKAIAAMNSLTMEKGLTVGQKIKVPLNEQNFDNSDQANPGEAIALMHTVAESETVFKIAKDNSVTAPQIRKWNNLTSDNIAPGTPLIIGHLKMGAGGSPVVAASNNTTAATNSPSAVADQNEVKTTKDEAKKESIAVGDQPTAGEQSSETSAPATNETAAETKSTKQVATDTAVVQRDTALAVVPEETIQPPVSISTRTKNSPSEKETASTKKGADNRSSSPATAAAGISTEGAFANLFEQSASQKTLDTKSGEAATFKSTSGWQDKKYYVLMSNVPPGTILKITSSENKVVYAKVLGSMPEMKENDGLLLRISNAAASYLGIIDPKFPVQISYYQ